MKIAVICSDERMIQVYDNLSRDFMVDRLDAQTDFLNLPQYQAVVFPVKASMSLDMSAYRSRRFTYRTPFTKCRVRIVCCFAEFEMQCWMLCRSEKSITCWRRA